MQVHFRTDLFEAGAGHSKAHCVSADLALGAGVAKQFRVRYGAPRPGTQPRVGDCVVQNVVDDDEPAFVFHLVTKERFWHKPSLATLRSALAALRDALRERALTEVWMPRIGCGLDRLNWQDVAPMILEVLSDWAGVVHVAVQ